ncbi:MAG: Response regulator receiver [Burkholderiales bacterium]|jgi:CheY-like chemotaxis protein|nr:Response regulator receiver [Burkholderiales bacterium]
MSLPLFYFPTTIVCVDDNALMLKTLDTLIHSNIKQHQVKKFDNSGGALDFLKNNASGISNIQFLRSFVEHEYCDLTNHSPVDLEISKFSELAENSNKVNEISLLIVDYEMPGLNGIELCQQLKDISAKKILLTAHGDYQKALNAFNNKLVDRFVVKGQNDTQDNLVAYIKSLTHEYFDDITAKLQAHLKVSGNLAVFDEIFIKFFNDLVLREQIKEYYLIDKNGSFLLINSLGQHSYLLVHTDSSLDYFVEIYNEEPDAEKYVKQVEGRGLIPCFGPDIYPEKINMQEWGKYFCKPQILKGAHAAYYWNIVKA